MKNWRNGPSDIGPPLHHADTRPRFTKIGFGGAAIINTPGPAIYPVRSSYEAKP